MRSPRWRQFRHHMHLMRWSSEPARGFVQKLQVALSSEKQHVAMGPATARGFGSSQSSRARMASDANVMLPSEQARGCVQKQHVALGPAPPRGFGSSQRSRARLATDACTCNGIRAQRAAHFTTFLIHTQLLIHKMMYIWLVHTHTDTHTHTHRGTFPPSQHIGPARVEE